MSSSLSLADGVRVRRETHWAQLELHNPGKHNAMSLSMWDALREALLDLAQDPQLRCVLVRGADGHFCAGGDIAQYPAFRFDVERLRAFHEHTVWGALQALLACPVPVVALIEGSCMGAGVEIASACDIRVAAHGARFGAPIGRLGFPMAPREADLVVRTVGDAVASAMLLAAEVYGAAELQACGFLSRVVPDAQCQQYAEGLLARMVQLAPQAARRNKALLAARRSGHGPALALPDDPYAYAPDPEHREGIAAFLEKRKPTF